MSFKAIFKIDGKDYDVLKCSYALERDTDSYGKPSSDVRGGKIHLMIRSTSGSFFTEWISNSFTRKKGEIEFKKSDTDSAAKTLSFEDAYMVNYEENFDHEGQNPMTEEFTISARGISVGEADFQNLWEDN